MMRNVLTSLTVLGLAAMAMGQDNANVAGSYLGQKNIDAAIDSYNSAIAANPNDGRLRVALGDVLVAKGEALAAVGQAGPAVYAYDLAIESLDAAVPLMAKPAAAYKSRGVAKYRKGDLDGAVADLTLALGQASRYADAYYYRALAYKDLGNASQAAEDLATLRGISRSRAHQLAGLLQ